MNIVLKTRQSNFELLRIFSMLLILIHHFICHGLNSKLAPPDLIIIVDSFAIIGVNLFLLISGYFKIRLSWKSFLNLVFICMFCKVVHLCTDTFVLGISHPLYEWILKPIFVISRSGGWFVQVYFMLMFISPLLNKAIDNLSEKEWKLSLALLSFISFYLGWILHNYNDAAGYTLMNFVFIYVIGAAIRHYNLSMRVKTWQMLFAIILGVVVTFVGSKFVAAHENLKLGFTAYNSPFVILTACAVFCIFSKIKLQNKWINKVAVSMLTVYLLTDGGHLSKVLYGWAGLVAQNFSEGIVLLLFLIMAVLIILVVSCLDQIRQFIFKRIFRLYENIIYRTH